jgi:hypothetical protein
VSEIVLEIRPMPTLKLGASISWNFKLGIRDRKYICHKSTREGVQRSRVERPCGPEKGTKLPPLLMSLLLLWLLIFILLYRFFSTYPLRDDVSYSLDSSSLFTLCICA